MFAILYMDKPLFVEINCLGPYDPRIQDVGVVLDLMIHDLDMVSFLIDSPVKSMEAFGARVLSKQEDIAKVRLRFENGCLADLSASRVSLETYRRIRIFQASSYMSIDYAKPDIKVYRKKGETLKSLLDVDRIHPTLRKEDALTLELSHFLYSVSTRQTPLVTGEQGLRAVSLAQDVLACLQIHE
jgi:predicted dehydrogenase